MAAATLAAGCGGGHPAAGTTSNAAAAAKRTLGANAAASPRVTIVCDQVAHPKEYRVLHALDSQTLSALANNQSDPAVLPTALREVTQEEGLSPERARQVQQAATRSSTAISTAAAVDTNTLAALSSSTDAALITKAQTEIAAAFRIDNAAALQRLVALASPANKADLTLVTPQLQLLQFALTACPLTGSSSSAGTRSASLTHVFTYTIDVPGGYTVAGTFSFGDPVRLSAGSATGNGQTVTPESVCAADTDAQKDAVIPAVLSLRNTTSGFSTNATTIVQSADEFNPPLLLIGDVNSGADCGYWTQPTSHNITFDNLAPATTGSDPILIFIKDYYSPEHPNGDPSMLGQSKITLGDGGIQGTRNGSGVTAEPLPDNLGYTLTLSG